METVLSTASVVFASASAPGVSIAVFSVCKSLAVRLLDFAFDDDWQYHEDRYDREHRSPEDINY